MIIFMDYKFISVYLGVFLICCGNMINIYVDCIPNEIHASPLSQRYVRQLKMISEKIHHID